VAVAAVTGAAAGLCSKGQRGQCLNPRPEGKVAGEELQYQ
jgi:hypothetical protein